MHYTNKWYNIICKRTHSEVIHGVLNVAGFIPGAGAVADLVNAGFYAAKGGLTECSIKRGISNPWDW